MFSRQKVLIKIDAMPGKKFTGHVDSIAPATGATFSAIQPDNATGNFTKVVQRLPVKIVLMVINPMQNYCASGCQPFLKLKSANIQDILKNALFLMSGFRNGVPVIYT